MYPLPSSYADFVNTTFLIVIGVSLFIVMCITIAMIYFVIRYNKKRNPVPVNIPGNTVLEIVWIVIPTLIALGFFWVGYIGFINLRTLPKESFKIDVTARMWNWSFKYPNNKRSNELYVPINKPILLYIRSTDVVHSFYIPALRVKEDAVPGMVNYLWFKPDRTGTYTIYCAEYCGEFHSAMLSKLHILSQENFNKWYNSTTEEQNISNVDKGEKIFNQQGCATCHNIKDNTKLTGSPLKDIYQRKVIVISNGKERQIISDEDYIKKAIIDPNADVVKGYESIMPSYKGTLSEEEINALIEYLKSNSKLPSQHEHNSKVNNSSKVDQQKQENDKK